MRLRSLAPLAAVTAAAAALAVVPALAADKSVKASNFEFTPHTVTVKVGDKVTWTNDGGNHNVRFDDGSFEQPKQATAVWSSPVERRFDKAGTYRYFCEDHGTAGGEGMSGTVIVEAANATPTPTASPSPTPTPAPSPGATPTPGPGASPTPTPTPAPGTSPTPAPSPAPAPDPDILPVVPRFTLQAAKRFCVGDCKRPGVFVRIGHDAGDTLTLRGTLRRIEGGKARAFGKVRLRVPAGGKRVRILRTSSGRRLTPGRYVLRLTVPGGETRKVRFRVTG